MPRLPAAGGPEPLPGACPPARRRRPTPRRARAPGTRARPATRGSRRARALHRARQRRSRSGARSHRRSGDRKPGDVAQVGVDHELPVYAGERAGDAARAEHQAGFDEQDPAQPCRGCTREPQRGERAAPLVEARAERRREREDAASTSSVEIRPSWLSPSLGERVDLRFAGAAVALPVRCAGLERPAYLAFEPLEVRCRRADAPRARSGLSLPHARV